MPAKKQNLELKRWEKRGKALGSAKNSSQWAIADWILDGMERFRKRDVYSAVEKLTGMTRPSLHQFKLTAQRFPNSTRVKNLSFGHHRLVASRDYTPDQRRRYLQHALEAHESVASFAAFLRKLDGDAARRADKRTHADRAADKIVSACDALRKSGAFVILLSKQPTPEKRTELVDKLRALVADLNSKVERLERIWMPKAMEVAAGR